MSLMKDGLWSIMDGSETAPEVESEGYPKFFTQRDRGLAIIVLSIDPSLLYVFGDPADPVAVWKKLSDQFQRKTWANNLVLRRRLHSLRLREGQSDQTHVKAMTELFDELSVVGDDVDKEDLVYLLASLPESYESLVTALEANTEVPEMETIVKRLLHEERKRKDKVEHREDKDGALSLKHKGRGPRCHFCNKFGHIQRNCHERQHNKSAPDSQDQMSGKQKHKVYSAETRSKHAQDEVGLVMYAFSAELSCRSSWIIDSGATTHVCNNCNQFIEMKQMESPLEIILGDGRTLKAAECGTVTLIVRSGSAIMRCKVHDVLSMPELTYSLLSVSKAAERGVNCSFDDQECLVTDANERLITVGPKVGKLYQVTTIESEDRLCAVTDGVAVEELWHR